MKGALLYWPTKLVSIFKESTLPPDFEADLALSVQGVEMLMIVQEELYDLSQLSCLSSLG